MCTLRVRSSYRWIRTTEPQRGHGRVGRGLDTLVDNLEAIEYVVTPANAGEAAPLERVLARAFDLALMDVQMLGLNGVEIPRCGRV